MGRHVQTERWNTYFKFICFVRTLDAEVMFLPTYQRSITYTIMLLVTSPDRIGCIFEESKWT